MTFLAGQWDKTINLSETADLTADELFWRGLAFFELGKVKEAIEALTDSLTKEPFNPMANFKMGQFYQQASDYEKAAGFYKKAAAQEPNLTKVYFPLAQVYIALEKYPSAYSLLLNAKKSYPRAQEIATTLQKLLTDHPELLKQQQTGADKRRQVAVVPKVLPITEGREKIPLIRIGLAEKISKFFIKTGAKFKITSGDKSLQGEALSILFFKISDNQIQIRDDQNKVLLTGDHNITLTYDNHAATTILFDVEYGHGTFWSGREDRVYRGCFDFSSRDGGITIVNRLNMEEYLYSVVPSEIVPHWPQAALEAQAMAARTYAITHLKAFESRGFDLLPTVASQVYSGVLVEKPSTNTAVDATRGQIVTYNGKPINAFYSGNNGGYSASSQDIWNSNIPYLQAVPDKLLNLGTELLSPADLAEWLTTRPQTYSNYPKYSGRSKYRWNLWVSRQDIEDRIKMGEKIGQINSITVIKRGAGGAVSQVLVKGTNGDYTIAGDVIRSKLGGLRSNLFIVEPKLDKNGLTEYFIFYGGGWGHGVGMCQSGAAGMAADGYKSSEILTHYYQGTSISNLY